MSDGVRKVSGVRGSGDSLRTDQVIARVNGYPKIHDTQVVSTSVSFDHDSFPVEKLI